MERISSKLLDIHASPICHESKTPMTTAGSATMLTSRQSIFKMSVTSAPFTLRMAISLLRRRTSSLV